MNQNLLQSVLEFLRRKMWSRRWQRAVTCLAAVVVFGTVYALVLPAITLSGPHPEITSEELTAWSGDELTLHVKAETAAGETEKLYVLSMEETGADLSEKYVFNEEGIALITAKDSEEKEVEIELHRVLGEKEGAVDYWFALEEGTAVTFDLELADEVDEARFSQTVEAMKRSVTRDDNDTATASDADKAAAAAGADKKPQENASANKENADTATASDAVKTAAAAGTKATGSNADVQEANAAAKTEEEKIVTEKDDDGFVQILDGAIVNDLEQDEDDDTRAEITSVLKVSAGSGRDLADAKKDADRNADKRENGQLKFRWKTEVKPEPEMLWSGDGADIAVYYDDDAEIPADAVLAVREIKEDDEDYADYLALTESKVKENAGAGQGVKFARFFDITILDAAGNEIEPSAPVKVVITYDEDEAPEPEDDINVLHFKDDEPEIMDVNKADGEGALSFTSDSFSVYALVGTQVLTTRYIDAKGESWKVTVAYGPESGLTRNTDLIVNEIPADSDAYAQRLAEAKELLKKETGSDQINYIRLFDISLEENGSKVEPKAPVQVEIAHEKDDAATGTPQVVHFGEEGPELLAVDSVSEQGEYDIVKVSQQSFSPEMIIYTPSGTGQAFDIVTAMLTLSNKKDPVNVTDTSADSPQNWQAAEGGTTTTTITGTLDLMLELEDATNHELLIQVPPGFRIRSYSATEKTAAQSGITKGEIADAYKEFVTLSELLPYNHNNNDDPEMQTHIVGVDESAATWASQKMVGYTKQNSGTEANVRLYCGDVHYKFTDGQHTVVLKLVLDIDQRLMHRRADTELMEPIVITSSSSAGTAVQKLYAKATGLAKAGITRANNSSAGLTFGYISDNGGTGLSAKFGADIALNNYMSSVGTTYCYSYYDELRYVLTYPEHVYFVDNSLQIYQAGYGSSSPLQMSAVSGETVTQTFRNGHLTATIEQGANGGGKITLDLNKGVFDHTGGGRRLFAQFQADMNYFVAGGNSNDYIRENVKPGSENKIASIKVNGYMKRNNVSANFGQQYFHRAFVADGGPYKTITLTAGNVTKRDINYDYDYKIDQDHYLGGWNIKPKLPYKNNIFYFANDANPAHLITDLTLHGTNIRDVYIETTNGRILRYEGNTGLSASQYGGVSLKHQIFKGREYLQEGEYIKSVVFTNDMSDVGYVNTSNYVYGGLAYHGQFNNHQETDVQLYVLQDGLTEEQILDGLEHGTLRDLGMVNPATQKPNFSTDHTKIGGNNVGTCDISISVVDKKTGAAAENYYPNDTLKFSSSASHGISSNVPQDTIVDPDVIISFPKGISLDTQSVYGTANGGATRIQLEVKETRETVVNGVTWVTYRMGVKEEDKLKWIAHEYSCSSGAASDPVKKAAYINVSFEAKVNSNCPDYNLDLRDILQWDPGTNGRTATNSGSSMAVTWADRYNFTGKSADGKYITWAKLGSIKTQPLPGMNVDLAIKADHETDFYTYNTYESSIAPVVPAKYADVQVNYQSTSPTEYFRHSVIYVPIPKTGVDYSKYFENIELSTPLEMEGDPAYKKTFEFDMDLTGPVHMQPKGDSQTKWTTYYAVNTIESNPNPHVVVGTVDDWEPVSQSGSAVEWKTEEEMNRRGVNNNYKNVVMVKFVADTDIEANASGGAEMRLYVHDVNEEPGGAIGNKYDYWRGYTKAVINRETDGGNWYYSSVIAATPVMENLVGQLFVDANMDGEKQDADPKYHFQKYTIEVRGQDDTNNFVIEKLTLNEDGSFATVFEDGKTMYLRYGKYKVTVKDLDPDFSFADTGSPDNVSTSTKWYNDLFSGGTDTATWEFEVTNTGNTHEQAFKTHYLGGGLKNVVSFALNGLKTLVGRDLIQNEFEFNLAPKDATVETPMPERTKVFVTANGTFAYGTAQYSKIGDYKYTITETQGSKPGVTYDGKETTVTVTVTADPDTGKLSAAAVYDNTAHEYDADKEDTAKARFTNVYAPKPVTISLKGTKTLKNETLGEGMFTFLLKATSSDASLMPEGTETGSDGIATRTVTNDGEGNFDFGSITYSGPGNRTYVYKITEEGTIAQASGIPAEAVDFDGHTATVTVTIEEDRGRAVLNAYVVYDNSSAESADDMNVKDKAAFTNIVHKQKVGIKKVDIATGATLSDAEFALYSSDETGRKADQPMMTVTTDENGLAEFGELYVGTYYLTETKAPDGYNKFAGDITVIVTKDNVSAQQGVGNDQAGNEPNPSYDEDTKVYTISVWNSAGYELPHTGGPGTFTYALGGLMILLVSALMYGFRKRYEG